MNQTMRLGIIGLVFLAALGLLMLRLWTMQVTEVHAYEEKSLANQSRIVFTPAPRGDVYDRNGVKLAGTLLPSSTRRQRRSWTPSRTTARVVSSPWRRTSPTSKRRSSSSTVSSSRA